jgi:hypothetical protein
MYFLDPKLTLEMLLLERNESGSYTRALGFKSSSRIRQTYANDDEKIMEFFQ